MNRTDTLYTGWHLFINELKRIFRGINYIAEMDITDRCNLKCKHCYQAGNTNHSDEIPLSVWEQRLSSLYKSGIRAVVLVGGEPSLRPDILKLANETFPLIAVITNGVKKIDEEFKHPIFISMDGGQETNDSIRGKGTFARIMENYSGDTRVYINITLMKENYRELEAVVLLAKQHGFQGVVCNIYSSCLGNNAQLSISTEDRKMIITELKRVKMLYPKMLDISWATIKWFEDADHRDSCFWRENVAHFDINWNSRKCFSDLADCSNCGSFSGALGFPWKKIVNYPIERIKMFGRQEGGLHV